MRSSNPKCKKVIFSDRAIASVTAETNSHINTETGGILLGQRQDNVWYVIENLDPGPESVFQTAYFEYDQNYVNHLANKIGQIYENPLVLLGLWHRHPGSFDSFSSTDDQTNQKFASLNQLGAISGLVNLDPYFRLTMYYVNNPLSYTKVPIEIGDDLIPKAFRQLKQLVSQAKKKTTSSSLKRNTSQTSIELIQTNQISQSNLLQFEEFLVEKWDTLASWKNYEVSFQYLSDVNKLVITVKPRFPRCRNATIHKITYYFEEGRLFSNFDGHIFKEGKFGSIPIWQIDKN